jgi:ankyrin repeat protein
MEESREKVKMVWRKIWRRFWSDEDYPMEMIKKWRKVLRRVPANYTPPASYPLPSTDPQLITYEDCEAFFQAVTGGSSQDVTDILQTHGPAVTTELSTSYNEHGQTPLLVAIQLGNLEMVQFLVDKLDVPIVQIGRFVCGGVEYLDVPALYAAIVCGELDIAAYLLTAEVRSHQTDPMIDSIVSSPNGRQEKINILELMGAVNFYFYETHPAPQNGLKYWRAALHLRHSTAADEPDLPKTILPSEAGLAFGLTSEFTTLEQLEQLSSNTFELFTQGLLVSQRVLDMVHPDGPHIFNLTYLCRCASVYSFGQQEQSGEASIRALRLFLQQSEQGLEWKGWKTSRIVNWALDIMTKSVAHLRQKKPAGQEEFPFASLMATFDFACSYMSHLQANRRLENIYPNTLVSLAGLIVELIFWASEMTPQWSHQDRQQFERSLSLFIAKDHRWGNANQNLLHTICNLTSLGNMLVAEIPQDMDDNDDSSSSSSDSGSQVSGSLTGSYGHSDDGLDDNSEFDWSNSNDGSDLDSSSDCDADAGGDLIDSPDISPAPADGDESQNVRDDDVSNLSEDEVIDPYDYDYSTDVSGCPSCAHHRDAQLWSDERDDAEFVEVMSNHGDEEEPTITRAEDSQLLLSVTRLILGLGADPNAVNLHGSTPLHLLAMNRSSVIAQSRLLLEYGARIDQQQLNQSNWTPLMLFQQWQSQLASQGHPDPDLQFIINYVPPPSLRCLASQVLHKSGILFDEDQVPPALRHFLQSII